MFKSEPIQPGRPSSDEVQRAVESSKDLYRACMELGAGNPSLGLAFVSLAIQYQTGEFGSDVAEFERRVADLLAEACQNNNPSE